MKRFSSIDGTSSKAHFFNIRMIIKFIAIIAILCECVFVCNLANANPKLYVRICNSTFLMCKVLDFYGKLK